MISDYKRYQWFDAEEVAPSSALNPAEAVQKKLLYKLLSNTLED